MSQRKDSKAEQGMRLEGWDQAQDQSCHVIALDGAVVDLSLEFW